MAVAMEMEKLVEKVGVKLGPLVIQPYLEFGQRGEERDEGQIARNESTFEKR